MIALRYLAVSLLIHTAFVGALVWGYCRDASPTVRAALEISSVDLSLVDIPSEAPKEVVFDSPRVAPERVMTPSENLPAPEDALSPFEVAPPAPDFAPIELPPIEPFAEAPLRARVEAPPRPEKTIQPVYPRRARRRGEEGDVVLSVAVAADGRVSHVSVVRSSGFNELDEAGMKAVKAARFAPARLDETPVASVVPLTISFRLR